MHWLYERLSDLSSCLMITRQARLEHLLTLDVDIELTKFISIKYETVPRRCHGAKLRFF